MQNTDALTQGTGDAPRILVVDNETRLLASLKIMLEQQGFEVATASGGAQACEKLGSDSFDVVLLDLLMPDLNGQQVMSYISDKGINTAVIIISVVTSFTAVSQALRKGAFDYLKKPFAREDLLNSIRRVLDKKQMEREQINRRIRLQKTTQLQNYILNNSSDVVFILDRLGAITFVNRAVEAALGYKPKRLQGKHFATVLADGELATLKDSIELLKSGNKLDNLEVRFRENTPAKSVRVLELVVVPIYAENFIEQGIDGWLQPPADFLRQSFFPFNPTSDNVRSDKNHQGPEQQKLKTGKQPDQLIGVYGYAKDVTERKAGEEYVNFQAYHDLLTRLPNRRLFNDRLQMAIAHGRRHAKKLAVLFLDLDGFKLINDSIGHTLGDQLLQSVAQRLQSCLREGDTLSRFGGDEFLLLLPDLRDQEAAGEVANKIIASVKAPFVLGQLKINIGVSIGIATFPAAGATMEQLVQHADIAMYAAKKHGKGTYQFFDQSMLASVNHQQKIAGELAHALRNGEFQVYYQPQLSAGNGSVTGLEALVRWHHPERGVLHPEQFMPLADKTQLLADISEWVLRTACRQVKQWIDAGYKDIRLAVNMSAAQLEHPALVATIYKLLEDYDFPAENSSWNLPKT